MPADKLPENYAKVIGEADSGAVRPGVHASGRRRARPVRGAPGHRPPARGRHQLRGRERPHPRAARPAARHPPLSRPAAQVDLRRRSGRSGRRQRHEIQHPHRDHARRSARHRARDHRARAGRAARRRDHASSARKIRSPAIPAARRVSVGTWELGSGDRRRRPHRGHPRRPHRRPRGRDGGQAGARAAKWTPSSPRPPTSTRSISPAFPIPATPNGWPTSPATWTWR